MQGLQWLNGKFDSEVKNENFQYWLKLRPKEKRREPWNWSEQRAHLSRPVTGVLWFEARAYARWLRGSIFDGLDPTVTTALTDYRVSLPTEAQWERAARAKREGDTMSWHEQRWPWGENETLAATYANVKPSGIGGTSAVGAFPPNDIGLHDIAGNAWEWMDNAYSPDAKTTSYPGWPDARPLKTHQDLDKCDRPSLRGGSWFDLPEQASCSYRLKYLPVDWLNLMGFRVVLSLAENEP